MGGSQSKADVLKEILNKVSIDILNKNSSATIGLIDQKNTLTLVSNVDTKISGIDQINSSVINVFSIQNSVATGALQSDLTAAISETLRQEAASIGYTQSNVNINSKVSSIINSKISNESISEIRSTVEQSNDIKILVNSGADISSVVQKNEAQMIVKMINDMNSSVMASLQTSGDIKGDLTQKVNPIISNFGMALIFIVIMAAAAYYFKDMSSIVLSNITKPAPMLLIGGIIIALLIFSIIN